MRQRARYAYVCSFCGKDQHQYQDQVSRLIAGPGGVYVCDECITKFVAIERTQQEEQKKRACSFCGKKQNQVQLIVDSPKDVHICDECIDLCQEIIVEQQQEIDHGQEE
jgi:ATP-dependent protease Clp ATPase subunit